MNVKSVLNWFSDNCVWALSPCCAVAAILVGVPFLSVPFFIWLAASLAWVMSCYFTPLRSYVGPARYYYQAGTLGQQGRFQECLDLVTTFLRRHPRDGHAYGLKALALAGLGFYEEALADADRAVSLKRHGKTLMVRGQILSWLGCHIEALSDLEASYRLRENPWTRFLMGTQYAALRQLDTALAIFSRSTRSVKDSMTYLCLADCLRLLSRTEEAEAAYREAETKARREVKSGRPSESHLAYSLAQLSQNLEAIDAAAAAIERDDSDTMALGAQALTNVRRRETDAAEAKLRRMLLISPLAVIGALMDPQFTPLLSEKRFRELLAWALGAQRQAQRLPLIRGNN